MKLTQIADLNWFSSYENLLTKNLTALYSKMCEHLLYVQSFDIHKKFDYYITFYCRVKKMREMSREVGKKTLKKEIDNPSFL